VVVRLEVGIAICETRRTRRRRAPPPDIESWRNEQPSPSGAADGGNPMNDGKVWFITGAGRGMGADFAKAVLSAGHALVATGRDPGHLAEQLGPSDELLAVKLDVTRPDDAESAVKAAVKRFGRIDVLVN